MDKLIQRYKNDKIVDKNGIVYDIYIGLFFIDNQPTVRGSIYKLPNKEYMGDVYGQTKTEVMKLLKENINIIIYDMGDKK
jgi:hypothetical protein